jgi:hypothetical protein
VPYLAQVRYVFPFGLSLPDTAFWVKAEDSMASVRAWSGAAERRLVLRPPQARQSEHQRQTLRSKNEQDGSIIRTVFINMDDDLFVEEVVDTVGFTRMDVTFECSGDVPSSGSPILGEIREKATTIVKKFLRAYRNVSDQVDVKVLSEMDSPLIEVSVSTNYTFTKKEIDAKFMKVQHSFQWLPPVKRSVSKGPLSDEQLKGLILLLDHGIEPEFFRDLLLEAKELSFINSNHRLSLVIAQTGFETYIQWRLVHECNQRTITLLTSKKGIELDVETAIATGDLRSDLLGTYMTFLLGRSAKDCSEHQEWYKNAYEPRNQIVHRGRVNVTESDARKAFESVVKYCDYTDRMLIESRGQTVSPSNS